MSSPIKDVLSTLSKHAEVVQSALERPVSQDSGMPGNALVALRQISALRPSGGDGYRLHPRLREYLQDHLQLFAPFQGLSEIGSMISLLGSFWNDLDEMTRVGDTATAAQLVERIETAAFDITDSMERNLLQLQTSLSTRYGNVKTLHAKQRENLFYQKQSNALGNDLDRLSAVCDKIEREANTRGRADLAKFLRQQILSKILHWQHGLSEMQTLIRKEIFRTRDIDRDHKLLARIDLMLRQQPAWQGVDADLSADIPPFLLATRLRPLRAHVEPQDNDREIQREMDAVAKSLPPVQAVVEASAPPPKIKRVVDEYKKPEPTPGAIALARLEQAVRSSPGPISLKEWWSDDLEAQTMSSGIWLVFSTVAMRSKKYRVDLCISTPRQGERHSHTFHDAKAYGLAS